ncbi:cyclin-J-like [Stegodyphus dumicola]|uniref:cyclin-J-like n=1 Tax=Stegodyphus dumicola TaxID=202533 RepID=UPI0015A7F780|nr:cyclin-J-like [Stegodyphus dumicola]
MLLSFARSGAAICDCRSFVKLEENEAIRPKNSEFNAIIGNKYSLTEFVLMEMNILTFFEWDISYPTAAHFAEYYAIYALSPSDSHNDGLLPSFEYVQQYVKKYIDYFLDVIILDYAFHKFNPSLVAASCIACTRKCLLLTPAWPLLLQTVTNYKYTELKSCMDLLLRALDADVFSNKQKESK